MTELDSSLLDAMVNENGESIEAGWATVRLSKEGVAGVGDKLLAAVGRGVARGGKLPNF